jgi:hypothetical protein
MEPNTTREATSCASTKKLINILWNSEIHYRVHKSPPLVPILTQTNPVHITQSYISKIQLNIIHTYVLVFRMVSFLLAFPLMTHVRFINDIDSNSNTKHLPLLVPSAG